MKQIYCFYFDTEKLLITKFFIIKECSCDISAMLEFHVTYIIAGKSGSYISLVRLVKLMRMTHVERIGWLYLGIKRKQGKVSIQG
jgi:hypothetical protein